MGKRFWSRLITVSFVFSLSFSYADAADSSVIGGSGKAATKTFVAEACNAEEIQGQLDQTDPKVTEHTEAAKSCFDEVKKSDQTCQPGSNPNAQNAQNQNQQYQQQTQQSTEQQQAAGGQGGGGQSNSCGGLGDLMKNIQPPISKYGQECKDAMKQCKAKCGEQVKKSETACMGLPPDKMQICKLNSEKVKRCAAKTTKACENYEEQAQGIATMMKMAGSIMSSMMKCQEDQGLDCTKDPSNPQCLKDDTVNCSDSKFASNPQCICIANPRAAGCPGAETSGLSEIAKKLAKDPSAPSGGPAAGGKDNDASGIPGRPKSAAGSPSGGGGGLMVGGSGGGKSADSGQGGAAKAAAANTDVNAGDYGGSPGRGVSGGGYPEISNPGGGRGMRNGAKLGAGAAGMMTGANGRSNWQKVRERYRDNRPTLLEQAH